MLACLTGEFYDGNMVSGGWAKRVLLLAGVLVLFGSVPVASGQPPGRSRGEARTAAHPPGQVGEGYRLYDQKRFLEAFEILDAAVRDDPQNRALAVKAYTAGLAHLLELYKAKQYQEVLNLVDHVTVLQPNDYQSYFAKGRAQQGLKLHEDAMESFREAKARTQKPFVRRALANSHVLLGNYPEAIESFEEIVSTGKATPRDLGRLGRSYYESGDLEGAIAAMNKALAITPGDTNLIAALNKYSQEYGVQSDYSSDTNVHFTVLFENTPAQRELKEMILRLLENAYDAVTRDLSTYPDSLVQVVIYPSKSVYREASDAPIWSAAVYNGKIRIPARETKISEDQLQRILQHEFTHLLVDQIGGRRVPTWVNEGLAQIEEGREVAWAKPLLRRVLGNRNLRPLFRDLKDLEGSFTSLPKDQARIVYAESYFAMKFMIDMIGMWGVTSMLEDLKEGTPPEDALRRATGYYYERFQDKWVEKLMAEFHLGNR